MHLIRRLQRFFTILFDDLFPLYPRRENASRWLLITVRAIQTLLALLFVSAIVVVVIAVANELGWTILRVVLGAGVVVAQSLKSFWDFLGIEGRLLLGGVFIAWVFLRGVEKQLNYIIRRLTAIEELLEK